MRNYASSETVTETLLPDNIVWRNVVACLLVHLAALYGCYLAITSAMWMTNVCGFALYVLSGLGVTAGAHRLWAHKSYKAKLPLRIFLAFFNTVAFQHHIYEWCRDHRVHHKYSETDADPHNAKRGFFFAHVGWLFVRKHPDVLRKGKSVDCSDLMTDPVVRFQRRFFLPLAILSCFVLPTVFCCFMWKENWVNALCVAGVFRYCFTLNCTFLVNSAAHMWGNRPYDENINPRENSLAIVGAIGEGFHNYHHTFPWDYSASEYGIRLNLTTLFIDAMALLGQAYARKTVTTKTIRSRKNRTGEKM